MLEIFLLTSLVMSLGLLAVFALNTPIVEKTVVESAPQHQPVPQPRAITVGDTVRVLSSTGRRVRRIAKVVEHRGTAVLLRSEVTGREFLRSPRRLLAA